MSLTGSAPVLVSDAGFTIELHKDNVELRERHNSPSIGTVSIGDAVYTPVP